MSTLTREQLAAIANQFPGKTVIIRDKAWNVHKLNNQFLANLPPTTPLKVRVLPDIVLLNPDDGSVFLETNVYGFIGPPIDFSKKLVAIWGDSSVAGWGKGWIEGLSEQFPGYQFLNGGVSGANLDSIAYLATQANKHLPITCNVIFVGWNTMHHATTPARSVYIVLHRLLNRLPNPILCTQPTSLNTKVIADDLAPFFASGSELGFRAGYTLWADTVPTLASVQTLYNTIVEQNEVIWTVIEERRKFNRPHVPVFDFFRYLDTTDAADFRDNFIDAGHFRVEAYPLVRRIFCEEFASLLGSLERAA